MNLLKRAAIVSVLTAGTLVSAPAVASAATYPSDGQVGSISYSISAPDQNGHVWVTLTFPDGKSITFDPPAVLS